MHMLTRLFACTLVVLFACSSALAQDRHVVDPAVVAGAVSQRVADQDKDRTAIHEVLSRPEVRDVAAKAGIDLSRAEAAVDTLNGPDLQQAAAAARNVNQALIGGATSVTLSTTTIIIILLVVILLIVAIK